jgi:hypothetical protein
MRTDIATQQIPTISETLNFRDVIKKIDAIDLIILRKFYFQGKKPLDTISWIGNALRFNLEKFDKIKMSKRWFNCRMKKLCDLRILKANLSKGNSTIYEPVENADIKKFLIEITLKIGFDGLRTYFSEE